MLMEMREILQAIAKAGGRGFLVGGCVRDMIMGIAPKDVDIEVYGLESEGLESVLAKFGKVTLAGKSFGVFKIGEFDVSIPRVERKTGEGHKGFEVESIPTLNFKEACRRRDLTINAILYDPLTLEFIDPFKGREDIMAGVIRHVDAETFIEDPLRVLRVAQFAARFNFVIHPETVELCRRIVNGCRLGFNGSTLMSKTIY